MHPAGSAAQAGSRSPPCWRAAPSSDSGSSLAARAAASTTPMAAGMSCRVQGRDGPLTGAAIRVPDGQVVTHRSQPGRGCPARPWSVVAARAEDPVVDSPRDAATVLRRPSSCIGLASIPAGSVAGGVVGRPRRHTGPCSRACRGAGTATAPRSTEVARIDRCRTPVAGNARSRSIRPTPLPCASGSVKNSVSSRVSPRGWNGRSPRAGHPARHPTPRQRSPRDARTAIAT